VTRENERIVIIIIIIITCELASVENLAAGRTKTSPAALQFHIGLSKARGRKLDQK